MVGRGTWRSRGLPVLETLVAAVLVVAAVATLAASSAPHPWGEAVAGLWMTALAFRTTSPVTMVAVASTGAVAYALVPGAPVTPLWALVAVLVVAFSLGSGIGGRRGVRLALVLLVAAIFLATYTAPSGQGLAASVTTPLAIIGAPWAGGWLLRRQRAQTVLLRRLGEELAAERRAHALAAAATERNRIARELHDVISHAVGAMVVQAGAADQLLPPGAPAHEALMAVRDTGREALAELRHQLGVLHTADGGPVPLPVIGDVVRLADETGASLEYDAEQVGDVSAGTALAAYRVVQEALTNARKHAAGAPVRVRVGRDTEELALDIVNGPGQALRDTPGSGHGLRGMRERVALYAGEFEAGSTPEGGWRVQARLPLRPTEHVLVTS